MEEFCTVISDNKSGQVIEVYFRPMIYLDWVKYSSRGSSILSSPSVIRYLFQAYITRAFIGASRDSDMEQLGTDDLCSSSVVVQQKIIESLLKNSIFGDEEEFPRVIDGLEKASRTLMGTYDFFIFAHGGLDMYLRCLEMDALTRAQIIMMLEKTAGVSVEARFKDGVSRGVPVDVISDDSKYHGERLREAKKRNVDPRVDRRRTAPQGSHGERPTAPPNVNEMIASSRQALESALNKDRKGPRVPFDWGADEASISTAGSRSDSDLFNKDIYPPGRGPSG